MSRIRDSTRGVQIIRDPNKRLIVGEPPAGPAYEFKMGRQSKLRGPSYGTAACAPLSPAHTLGDTVAARKAERRVTPERLQAEASTRRQIEHARLGGH